jgi:signal transduction histidine kinase
MGTGSIESIPLRRTPVELRGLVESALAVLHEQSEEIGVRVIVTGPEETPPVQVDADKIAWVVVTLVGNALRYIREATGRSPGSSIYVKLQVDPAGVSIAVEDDGPGIPTEKLAAIFDRHGDARHGVGLSLLLARDVVRAHGGDVEIKSPCSPVEGGTCVTLRIPPT